MNLSFLTVFSFLMFSGIPVENRFDLIVEVRPGAGHELPVKIWVSLDRDTGHHSTALVSNQDNVRFTGLPWGRYWITVEAEGYQSSRFEFSADSSDGDKHLTVNLSPPEFDEVAPVETVDYRLLRLSSRASEYWRKAREAIARERFEEAVLTLEQMIRMEPDFVDAHRTLGAVAFSLGRWNQAEKAFQKAISLDPNRYQRHLDLGYFYLHLERPAEAIAPLKKAVEMEPENAGVRAFLGEALRLNGRMEEGIVHLEKAIALNPTLGLALHSLGAAYLALNKPARALQSFEALLKLEGLPDGEAMRVKNLVSQLKERLEAEQN